MRKLIISLPAVLTTILTIAASSTTTVAYGQDFLIGGSPNVPVQIDPERASPLLVEPSTPSPLSSSPPPTTPQTPPPTEQKVIIDRPTAARLAAEDPYFARFEQILEQCQGLAYGEPVITTEQCVTSLQQGADRWCGLEFYDALKCEYASAMVEHMTRINNILKPFGPGAEQLFGGLMEEYGISPPNTAVPLPPGQPSSSPPLLP